MGKKKPYGVKVTKAYEQGKEDALAYRKLNPEPSKWVKFLGFVSNSNLTKKYDDSYRIGYFEVVNKRKGHQLQTHDKKEQIKDITKPNNEIGAIDNAIEELEKIKNLLVVRKKQSTKNKDPEMEMD